MEKILFACGLDCFTIAKILDMKAEMEHKNKMRTLLDEMRNSMAFSIIYDRMVKLGKDDNDEQYEDYANGKNQDADNYDVDVEHECDGFVLDEDGIIATDLSFPSYSDIMSTYKSAGFCGNDLISYQDDVNVVREVISHKNDLNVRFIPLFNMKKTVSSDECNYIIRIGDDIIDVKGMPMKKVYEVLFDIPRRV